MTETGRSLAWRWVMLVLALAFPWAWPTLRPVSMSWSSWAPALWVTGLVWLAWSTKNWLLGLMVGLTAILHPDASITATRTPLGEQLACLALTAAWCAQFGELVWHPRARWKSWLAWTAVGCVFSLPVGWQDSAFAYLVYSLLWFNTLALLLLWWLQQTGQPAWHRLASLLSVVAVSSVVPVIRWLWPGEMRTSSWWPRWESLYSAWGQAIQKFLPWPTWLGGIWLPTILLAWAWWRSVRRAYYCWKQAKPVAALVLTSAAPLITARILLDQNSAPGLFVPLAALLLGYGAFDLVQNIFERMRLEPPTTPPTSTGASETKTGQ